MVQKPFFIRIIYSTAVSVIFCTENQAGLHRILMHIVYFLVDNGIAPKFNRFIIMSPKLILVYI